VVIDNGTPTSWKITQVRYNGTRTRPGNGRREIDWAITGDHTVLLRAARSGPGDRVYTITIEASDASGNVSAPKAVTVTVSQKENRFLSIETGNEE
jgi:hypothetical protein